LSGQSITAVAPRGSAIVVATTTGIWRSHDSGASFTHLGKKRGLVRRHATDLSGDPLNPEILYAGIVGAGGGVFRSDDGGICWKNLSGAGFGHGRDLVTGAKKIMLSVHNGGTHSFLYVGIIGADKNPSGFFRSSDLNVASDQPVTWTALDVPPIEQAAQARLSILADPRFPDLFYAGGDEPDRGGDDDAPAGSSGPVYRCDASRPRGEQCHSISGVGTIDGTAPHSDSRRMQFDANDDLLETDDGGIFRNPRPRTDSGTWASVNGDLSITETHSCAWDHVRHVSICGTQDNGTNEQPSSGATVWKNILGRDGGDVAVFNSPGISVEYYSTQSVGNFTSKVCLGAFCNTSKPALNVFGAFPLAAFDQTLAGYEPIAVHPRHANRLIIGSGFVYESTDGGDTLIPLFGFSGLSTQAIAYGSAADNDVLYIGSSDGVFRHTSVFESLTRLATYPGRPPAAIALDPADWRSAWVVDSKAVWHTPDGGSTWDNFTGDLHGAGAQDVAAVALVPGSSGFLIFVGASDGLYVMSTTQPGSWSKLSGKLPNAVVSDLRFDATDDILLIATMGRGAWVLPGPETLPIK
jgi:photosystem II stability/assembly factor-like uncharacterized protein